MLVRHIYTISSREIVKHAPASLTGTRYMRASFLTSITTLGGTVSYSIAGKYDYLGSYSFYLTLHTLFGILQYYVPFCRVRTAYLSKQPFQPDWYVPRFGKGHCPTNAIKAS